MKNSETLDQALRAIEVELGKCDPKTVRVITPILLAVIEYLVRVRMGWKNMSLIQRFKARVFKNAFIFTEKVNAKIGIFTAN